MSIGPWIATHTAGGRLMLASLGAAGAITGLSSHFIYTAGIAALSAAALLQTHRNQLRGNTLHRQELALRKELLAYLLFNGSPRSMAPADLGRQISRLIAVRSSFGRAALMLRDETGTMCVVGSAGFDDLSVKALTRWGKSLAREVDSVAEIAATHDRVATSSFTLELDRRCAERHPLSTMSCKKVHIVPLHTSRGLVGALVVCIELRSSARSSDLPELPWLSTAMPSLPLSDLLQPLEALALRLTMQLTAPENVTPLWPARTASRHDRRGRQDGPDRQDRQDRQDRPDGPDGPDRPECQIRHTRITPLRDRAARFAEGSTRQPNGEVAPAIDALRTAEALNPVRTSLDPASVPTERTAGASGRPPARIWRQNGGLSLL